MPIERRFKDVDGYDVGHHGFAHRQICLQSAYLGPVESQIMCPKYPRTFWVNISRHKQHTWNYCIKQLGGCQHFNQHIYVGS